jgi:hypothetical protein
MTPVERVKKMLSMSAKRPIKDVAGVIIPQGFDNSIRVKTLKEVIFELERPVKN